MWLVLAWERHVESIILRSKSGSGSYVGRNWMWIGSVRTDQLFPANANPVTQNMALPSMFGDHVTIEVFFEMLPMFHNMSVGYTEIRVCWREDGSTKRRDFTIGTIATIVRLESWQRRRVEEGSRRRRQGCAWLRLKKVLPHYWVFENTVRRRKEHLDEGSSSWCFRFLRNTHYHDQADETCESSKANCCPKTTTRGTNSLTGLQQKQTK